MDGVCEIQETLITGFRHLVIQVFVSSTFAFSDSRRSRSSSSARKRALSSGVVLVCVKNFFVTLLTSDPQLRPPGRCLQCSGGLFLD